MIKLYTEFFSSLIIFIGYLPVIERSTHSYHLFYLREITLDRVSVRMRNDSIVGRVVGVLFVPMLLYKYGLLCREIYRTKIRQRQT